MRADLTAVVFDHTAVSAMGSGNRLVSRFISRGSVWPGHRVYVPALCLVAASVGRDQLADHVGMLSSVEVVELGYPSVRLVARLIARGVDWRMAHAVEVGGPGLQWPKGRPVVTTQPQAYAGLGVATIAA